MLLYMREPTIMEEAEDPELFWNLLRLFFVD